MSILAILRRRISRSRLEKAKIKSRTSISRGEKRMRYLCLYKPAKKEGVPPTPQEMAEMGKLIEDMTREGVMLATEGCTPTAMGAKVRLADGKFTVSDGPFTEAKEIVGGFAIL